ncbi:MAG: hypothetical protein ACRCS8_02645 [Brevinema sp.]
MNYPIKFLLPNQNFKNVSIHSDDFPSNLDLNLYFDERNNCFCSTLELPAGQYSYQFNIDGEIVHDQLRAPQGGFAHLILTNESGIIFDIDKIFIKNNHVILFLGLDHDLWDSAVLNLQTLQGIQSVNGFHGFYEGAFEYQIFMFPIPADGVLLGYFELRQEDTLFYLGENGIKEEEWSVCPIEIFTKDMNVIAHHNDMVALYELSNSKAVLEFEKHCDYFEKFPVDHLVGDIDPNSILFEKLQAYPKQEPHHELSCLLRDIFIEKEDLTASMGLLGRYAYEHQKDLSTVSISLSDDQVSFWHVCHRELATAMRGILFQLLCTVTPKILFGEEIGLCKAGNERSMYWTKTKWNKDLYHFYVKLLKLRKKYPVLRQGSFRFVLQDCVVWGIERFMEGEESIYIFANHSKQNIVIDLTQVMNHSGAIIELLTEHPLKRKRVCTIFADSIGVFKMNGVHIPLKEDEELIEEY